MVKVVHTPRYLLRRRLILHMLKRYTPGSFLEMGCGRGELLPWLAARGFTGVGYDISQAAADTARKNISAYGPRLEVVVNLDSIRGRTFKYVFAFEVLEHIEDDEGALREWGNWLDPDGMLVISVPAHMAMWTAADDRGGHYRRYEQFQIKGLLERCGYEPQLLWNYGFPLTAMTRHFRSTGYLSLLQKQYSSKEERSMDSSWESTIPWNRGSHVASSVMEGASLGFHALQLIFRASDLGDGYLVSSRIRA